MATSKKSIFLGVSATVLLSVGPTSTVALSTFLDDDFPPSVVPSSLSGIVPADSWTHFCVISSWDSYNETLNSYASMLGQKAPDVGIAGGLPANGTYLGNRLKGTTKIAFLDLNSKAKIELLAGDPYHPSWWRDVYNRKGKEAHHMGYQLPENPNGPQIWEVVTNFEKAGLGHAVQWARWGNEKGPNVPGSGCYVYLDSQSTLGWTTEVLATGPQCDSLPTPEQSSKTAWMPSVKLQNAAKDGETYPVIGLGTGGYGQTAGGKPECWWDICDNGEIAEESILKWLELGGRRIDDATSYYHQKATGRALKRTSVPREDIYYVSKIGPSDALGYNDTLAEAKSIRDVAGLNYVDALLVHWPTGGQQGTISGNYSSDPLCQTNETTYDEKGCRLNTWRAMVELYESGFARAIGVSNYNETHLREIVDAGMPLPALTQLPYNPHRYRSHARMEQLCKSLGIVVSGYSPFGVADLGAGGGSRGGHVWPKTVGAAILLDEPAVLSIASKHNVSAAQILIAWSLSIGVTVNPRTNNEAHMIENLKAWEINLSKQEVMELSMLPESTCDIDPNWYECTPTEKFCPPQCCSKIPCPADSQGNCCAGGGQ